MPPILFIYLAQAVGNAGVLLVAVASLAVSVGLLCGLVSFIEGRKDLQRRAKKYVAIGLAMAVIGTFIPSERTLYLMAGVSALTDLTQDERVRGIADNSIKVVEKALADYLADAQQDAE